MWLFSEFSALLPTLGKQQLIRNLETKDVPVMEDRTMSPGTVEIRLVPRHGQPYGSALQ